MTLAIYIASTQPHSGKTALCAGLLRRFQADKYRVGYMKPVSTGVRAAGQRYIGLDAHFIKYALGFPDNLDQMAPVLLTHDLLENAISNGEQGLVDRVRTAYQAVSAHRDAVFLEGATHLREGRVINLEPEQVGQLFNACQLAVAPYQDTQQVIDDLLAARHRLGDSLVGTFINQTPEDRLEYANTRIKPFLERRGVPVLAILPQVNALRGASVAELADGLNGEILCCHHAVDQMVEHLMVGAMDAALAFNYFRRTPNKAVITSGDRLDLQLSALETSTRCLILTDNIPPSPVILDRAASTGTPIILTYHDTLSTVEICDRFFGKNRFHSLEKLDVFSDLLEKHLDYERLYRLLGLR